MLINGLFTIEKNEARLRVATLGLSEYFYDNESVIS